MVPIGGERDQATPALLSAPLTTAVKDTVWPEVRETEEGVRDSEFKAGVGVTARAPVAIPGINDMIELPLW
jgi:hypothetical protein